MKAILTVELNKKELTAALLPSGGKITNIVVDQPSRAGRAGKTITQQGAAKKPATAQKTTPKIRAKKTPPLPLNEWLHELAAIDSEWRKKGKYGKHIEKKVLTLINNKPMRMTEVYISASTYRSKFGKRRRRSEKTS